MIYVSMTLGYRTYTIVPIDIT